MATLERDEDILELIQIFREDYNVELSYEEALRIGTQAVEFFRVISQPIPKGYQCPHPIHKQSKP